MTFDEVLAEVRELLQREGRVSYRALKRRFTLDDDYIEDLKAELIDAKHLAVDEDSKVLVWVGKGINGEKEKGVKGKEAKRRNGETGKDAGLRTPDTGRSDGERRQLTVMFCDLVDSTALSTRLDPEELREVVRAYQETCTRVVQRYEGHIAQHLGDGLLVYFGYPTAHEDDAARAVRAGLEIITAIQTSVPSPLAGEPVLSVVEGGQGEGAAEARHAVPLRVRIGIHTGLVVIGEIGSSEKREILALGETPNIAARLQGVAEPNAVVCSAVTQRLVEGLFQCQGLGSQMLKGLALPLMVYRVVRESEALSRFDVAVQAGLTPLVGRGEELALLRRRWKQATEGEGRVVLLSGEPGIGKSRLVQELKDHVAHDRAVRIEFRCSPYHQNSALYPIIDHLQRLLRFAREDSPEAKLKKLENVRVGAVREPPLQSDTIPLLAALLSLPHPVGYPPLTVSPQKQKEKTHEALVAWLIAETKHQPVCTIWEDLHWADPSTLEVLNRVVDQAPATKLYMLLTFRPEFTPPWGDRSHISQLTLRRLGRPHVESMVENVTRGKALPSEILQQIVSKTDGVPLFVEELTKTVVESGLVQDEGDRYVGAHGDTPIPPLAIPSTLHDSLMARLDRLAPVKEIAQLGATLGREFSYELLHAVSPLDERTLQQGLRQLVEVELLYQRGLPPRATYFFKHALIQDTAYQSLLKSRRQQYHQQIARRLEEQFLETKETQPELLAHHYTEAGLIAQAIPYWQRAGQRASQRGANTEAVKHLTTGLELLKSLPDTPIRAQQELPFQLTLGALRVATHGFASPEVEHTYRRARELCEQIGDQKQALTALSGLALYYAMRAEHQTACALADQLLSIAQEAQDPDWLIAAHRMQGSTRLWIGEFLAARAHLEQAIAIYELQQHRADPFRFGYDLGVACRLILSQALWILGYPDQALIRAQEAFELVQGLSHINTLGYGLASPVQIHYLRGEWQAAQARAEAIIAFATEVGLPYFTAQMTIFLGAALAGQGHYEEGITKMRYGLAAQRATGGQGLVQLWLALQIEALIETGRFEEGWTALEEALAIRPKCGDRYWEAELYRLKGELMLAQAKCNPELQGRSRAEIEVEVEACYQQAIDTARELSAKSWELRAATGLARLWQQQSKHYEAHKMLSEVHGWFTEGFDTKDLQEAKALLDELI